ncbi:DUF2330 domain-containing protein [Yoonia sp. R2-816]|uniref:DUF2330 domain-containing protein n=1 Tax=Yoonia sp. R2-816 TaxID=3342638 RepID=UPI0037276448
MLRSFIISLTICWASQAAAFCGFYVAQDDGELYNTASKVVFVRDGYRSRITMASDYTGPTSEFAMIVPTPNVLEEKQIRTVDPAAVAHLENYTAPRLVEYFDYDPCAPQMVFESPAVMAAPVENAAPSTPRRGRAALGVRVEAEYSVGEYDIVILSAQQSDGLITYLRQESYTIPDGAEDTLAGYIAMDMKFFVARVNLERHAQGQSQDLRPLQISFRSPNFMLPLQLGKINSTGTQDLLMLMLTREGRVEAENYPNARIPSDVTVPTFVEDMFGQFYRDMFAKNAAPNTVMTEYAWDMGWCDPCAADPLNIHELRDLGAVWVKSAKSNPSEDVFVTRLHIQYDRDEFPEDLMFRVTDDNSNFQGRYIMNQPFEGELTCEAGQAYLARKRDEIRADALALRELTNWRQSDIDRLISASVPARFR